MAINKVVYGNNTLVDLTEDTVTPETLMRGITAHDASGNQIIGTATGLPDGGTIGQILAKSSDDDYDANWYNPHHLPNNKWYLVGSIGEEQVVAAYQFVNRFSEADALININEGTKYPLTKSGDDVIWDNDLGYLIPGSWNKGLYNTTLDALIRNYVYSAAFGYNRGSLESGVISGGLASDNYTSLHLKGMWGPGTAIYEVRYPAIYKKNNNKGLRASSSTVEGVLGGNWYDSSCELYRDGVSLSLTQIKNGDGNDQGMKDAVVGRTFGQINWANKNVYTSFGMTAVVMYTRQLDLYEHLELSENVRNLGGIEL